MKISDLEHVNGLVSRRNTLLDQRNMLEAEGVDWTRRVQYIQAALFALGESTTAACAGAAVNGLDLAISDIDSALERYGIETTRTRVTSPVTRVQLTRGKRRVARQAKAKG